MLPGSWTAEIMLLMTSAKLWILMKADIYEGKNLVNEGFVEEYKRSA